MFTVYIDDSGTDPNQSIAIASALIIPTDLIHALGTSWSDFLQEEFIPEFHTSECVAGQKDTPFQGWSLQRKKRICFKVREITKQFFVGACSFAINKAHYDEYVTEELRQTGGRYHYTWAIRHLISWLDAWAAHNNIQAPYEYIFDFMGQSKRNEAKKEIEIVMAQAESLRSGYYEGHYSFRNRREYPGLQCVDLLAWTNYRFACFAFNQTKLHSIAEETFWDYEKFQDREWMNSLTQRSENLKDWAQRELADPRSQERRRQWILSHST